MQWRDITDDVLATDLLEEGDLLAFKSGIRLTDRAVVELRRRRIPGLRADRVWVTAWFDGAANLVGLHFVTKSREFKYDGSEYAGDRTSSDRSYRFNCREVSERLRAGAAQACFDLTDMRIPGIDAVFKLRLASAVSNKPRTTRAPRKIPYAGGVFTEVVPQ